MKFKHSFSVACIILLVAVGCEQNKQRYYIGTNEVTKAEYYAKLDSMKNIQYKPSPDSIEVAIDDLEKALLDHNYKIKYNHSKMIDSIKNAQSN